MTPINSSQTHAEAATAAAERRILLIEDSDALSRRLVELLSEPGYIAVAAQAATQSEALSRLKEELAEGNGVAVVRSARQLYAPDAQPLIIVLTNYASDFVREHCFAAGADYFLDKMRDISKLKALVANGRSKWAPSTSGH
jgi:CheY-like chemotaxis protein